MQAESEEKRQRKNETISLLFFLYLAQCEQKYEFREWKILFESTAPHRMNRIECEK